MKKNIPFLAVNLIGFLANSYAMCHAQGSPHRASAKFISGACNFVSYRMITNKSRQVVEQKRRARDPDIENTALKYTLHRCAMFGLSFVDILHSAGGATDMQHPFSSPDSLNDILSGGAQLTNLIGGIDPQHLNKPTEYDFKN